MNNIQKTSLDLIKNKKYKSFAIRARRDDKKFKLTSKEIEIKVGEFVRKNTKAKVNLTKPAIQVNIEIYKNKAYLSTKSIKGLWSLAISALIGNFLSS